MPRPCFGFGNAQRYVQLWQYYRRPFLGRLKAKHRNVRIILLGYKERDLALLLTASISVYQQMGLSQCSTFDSEGD